MVVVDALLVRILLPTTAVGLALIAEERGFGLFNMIALPMWAGIIASVMLLDLAIYLQHVLFHAVPVLWRLCRYAVLTMRRPRVKDAVNTLWWFSKTTSPQADNRRVLRPYSPSMRRLLRDGYQPAQRPSHLSKLQSCISYRGAPVKALRHL